MRGQGSSGEGQIGAVGAGIKVNSEGIWWTGKEKQLRGLKTGTHCKNPPSFAHFEALR